MLRRPLYPMAILACLVGARSLVCQPSDLDASEKLWRGLKRGLLAPNGRQYFENSVKHSLLPVLEGTLVSSTPKDHPAVFLVALPDSDTPVITLRLKGSLQKPLPPGTPVSFEGVAMEFQAQPFMLTFDVETVNRATVPVRKLNLPAKGKKNPRANQR